MGVSSVCFAALVETAPDVETLAIDVLGLALHRSAPMSTGRPEGHGQLCLLWSAWVPPTQNFPCEAKEDLDPWCSRDPTLRFPRSPFRCNGKVTALTGGRKFDAYETSAHLSAATSEPSLNVINQIEPEPSDVW